MMTSEFINEEISMLFCSKKFSGGWWVGGWWWWYGVIIESISRSRPETRECLWVSVDLEVDLDMVWTPSLTKNKTIIIFMKLVFGSFRRLNDHKLEESWKIQYSIFFSDFWNCCWKLQTFYLPWKEIINIQ